MANTYLKIYLHVVFAVKNRNELISPFWRSKLYAYLSRVLQDNGCQTIEIGGIEDHVHILFSMSPTVSLSDLIRDMKAYSTKFVNDQRLSVFKFEWQKGYACMSYSSSQVEAVKRYIANQSTHHKGISLIDEIKAIFEKYGIDYDERYIFTEPK